MMNRPAGRPLHEVNGVQERQGSINTLVRSLRQCGPARRAVLSVRDLHNRLMDRRLGINTTCPRNTIFCGEALRNDAVYYEATDYSLLRRYMRPLALKPHDVVFEVGCGMGRTLCMFARQPVRHCIGIELLDELARQARCNAATLRQRRSTIEVRQVDAATADYSGGTVYWFNNPFGEATMREVLARIEHSVQLRPRPVQIVYIYPFCEHLFQQSRWLTCTHRVRPLLSTTSEAAYFAHHGPANEAGVANPAETRSADMAATG